MKEPNNEVEIQYLFGLESFRQNQDANLAALEEVRAAAELAQLGGGAKCAIAMWRVAMCVIGWQTFGSRIRT